ncbi:hypothetical protein QFC20_007717 [Naganishia adeliensis]|uniref:Uncharacterized protein n=1 Tax=Naganishia adeliensis TaxID=92952 RepID=A0ACC2UW39_9TREE|nr:hypothetical protein QFC20_007717 [Naganishia adeliensis]
MQVPDKFEVEDLLQALREFHALLEAETPSSLGASEVGENDLPAPRAALLGLRSVLETYRPSISPPGEIPYKVDRVMAEYGQAAEDLLQQTDANSRLAQQRRSGDISGA